MIVPANGIAVREAPEKHHATAFKAIAMNAGLQDAFLVTIEGWSKGSQPPTRATGRQCGRR
jgi:hypothetical protein